MSDGEENIQMFVAKNEPQANESFLIQQFFQKCWRGVGEQPTFAKQIVFADMFFLLQLHFLKLSNSNKVVL